MRRSRGPKIRLPATSYEERCKARETEKQPYESVSDFKHRLAIIMRERETGKRYSIIGAARPHPCVIRNKSLDNTNRDGILTSDEHSN